MVETIIGKEPDPLTPPVRMFIDSSITTEFASLEKLRVAMGIDDRVIIDGIANRRMVEPLIQAFEGTIGGPPATTHAIALANETYPDLPELPGLLTAVYAELAPEQSPALPYDEQIVAGVAARLRKVIEATLFKKDKGEGLAPEQQRRNREKAAELAASLHPYDKALPGIVERIYARLVPESVAIQQGKFADTILLSEI